MDDLFEPHELEVKALRKDELPLNNEILLYVVSRKKANKLRPDLERELTNQVGFKSNMI